jgi:hypothetical protein
MIIKATEGVSRGRCGCREALCAGGGRGQHVHYHEPRQTAGVGAVTTRGHEIIADFARRHRCSLAAAAKILQEGTTK